MAFRNLVIRFIFGGLLAALSLLIARWKISGRVLEWTDRRFDRILIASYAGSHFLMFFVAFFVLHQKPWADLIGFYVPQAHSVMHGLMPYRDFESSYAPLNPYLDATLLRLHDSPLSILVFQIVCDVLSVPFWIRFLRRFLSEATVRKAALLYFAQPLVAWEICLDGKNQGLIALLLGISFWAIARREIVSAISLSASWILVKFLPMMFVPFLFVGARKRILWLLTAAVPTVLVYGAFVLMKADVTAGVRRESSITTPQNLPYLFGMLTGYDLPGMVLALLSLVAVLTALVIGIRAQLRARTEPAKLWKMALGAQLILLSIMVTNKKSDTSYLGMCFFLLCAFVAFDADRGKGAMGGLYALLSFLALPIASFWYWPLNREDATLLHAMWLSGNRNAWIMIVMQVLLVVSYAGLALGILRGLREPSEDLLRKEDQVQMSMAKR